MILFEKDLELCEFIESVIDQTDTQIVWGDVLDQDPQKLLEEK